MSTVAAPPLAPPPPPVDVEASLEAAAAPDPEVVAFRRRYRNRLLLWSLAPVLLVFVVALKLLSLPALAATSQVTYEQHSFSSSVAASDGLGIVNVFEPWVRHFDRGTALARIGVLEESRTSFENALTLVPTKNVAASCMVRTDLALVVEQQGDSAVLDQSFDKAVTLYKHALALIADAPTGCFDTPGSSTAPPTKKPLDDEKARLQQKQQQAEQGAGGSSGSQGQGQGGQGQGGQGQNGQGSSGSGSGSGDQSQGQGGSGGQSPLDKLQQQNGEAQKQQQQNNDRDRDFSQNPKDYSGKPW